MTTWQPQKTAFETFPPIQPGPDWVLKGRVWVYKVPRTLRKRST